MDKPYLLDGEPVTFVELIHAAEAEGYDGEGFCRTSEAAAILRANGYTVAENSTLPHPGQTAGERGA